jgi:SRSO17 transposase
MRKRTRDHSTSKPPASGRPPVSRLTERDLQAAADELIGFHRLFHVVFRRREQREWSAFYLCGQLANLKRKTIEPMVLTLRGADPNAMRGLQQYISQGTWSAGKMILRQQALVAEWLGDPAGVVILDGSGFPKEGASSVGVARQYCGAVGKVANSQEGVFMVYASPQGYAFLDERLYVHESWFSEDARARWAKCDLPADLCFQTEHHLALDMLRDLIRRRVVPFRWIAADAHFGEVPAFLDDVAASGKWYLIEVPCDTRAWLHTPTVEPPGCGIMGRPRTHPRVVRSAPRPLELRALAATLPKTAWTRHVIKEGSKGPLVAQFAFLRVTAVRQGLPGPRVWVVFRRQIHPEPELKFYMSNAPATCPRTELVRVCGLRWPVETTLEEGKDELGMDHHQTRSWVSWHHHMAQTFMAHLFLMRLRLVFKKKSCVDHGPSTSAHRASIRRRTRTQTGHPRHYRLPATAQLRSLLLASPQQMQAQGLIFSWASTEREVTDYPKVSE